MDGECVTGITIMRMEAGLDSGPILMQRAVGIGLDDSSATLHDELAREGADMLCLALQRLMAGTLTAISQDERLATYAPKLQKSDSALDLDAAARILHARIRGLTPWPGASLVMHRPGLESISVRVAPGRFPLTEAMKVAETEYYRTQTADDQPHPRLPEENGHDEQGPFIPPPSSPGRIIGLVDNALLVTCRDGCYAFTDFSPANKRSMDAAAFYNGYLATSPEAWFSSC